MHLPAFVHMLFELPSEWIVCYCTWKQFDIVIKKSATVFPVCGEETFLSMINVEDYFADAS